MKLLQLKKIKDGRFLKNYELAYENKKGNLKTYEMISRNDLTEPSDLGQRVNGVVIVATHKSSGRLLLLKEFRMAVNQELINLVSGIKDPGEDIETCVKRELFEETGLQDVRITRTLKPAYSAAGMSDEQVVVVFAEVDGTFEDNSSDNESIKPRFYSKAEVAQLLQTESFAANSQLICELWVQAFSA